MIIEAEIDIFESDLDRLVEFCNEHSYTMPTLLKEFIEEYFDEFEKEHE